MRRLDFRLVIGALLILLGGMMLLERFNIITGATDLFWGGLFVAGGAAFFFLYLSAPQSNWWAVIPAFTLAGIGIAAVLPASLEGWGGFALLGSIGVSFLVIYLTASHRWWAIIPGGVLLTLGLVALLSDQFAGQDLAMGGIFFLGLGVTFLLVAILPNPVGSMNWAYIPAAVLLVIGAVMWTPFFGLMDYLWPAGLFLAGFYLIWRFFRSSRI